jgi:tRNA1(Val) A37 N6-methylase TrmN6
MVKREDRNKYILIEDGFETAKLPDTKFDLVLTSPPFFDLEIYSQSKNDSVVKYSQEQLWIDNFFAPSINKAINKLDSGGYFILYIHHSKLIDEQLLKINKILNYQGMLYFFDNKPRGISVWRKN